MMKSHSHFFYVCTFGWKCLSGQHALITFTCIQHKSSMNLFNNVALHDTCSTVASSQKSWLPRALLSYRKEMQKSCTSLLPHHSPMQANKQFREYPPRLHYAMSPPWVTRPTSRLPRRDQHLKFLTGASLTVRSPISKLRSFSVQSNSPESWSWVTRSATFSTDR
jgi:hypothetical protein